MNYKGVEEIYTETELAVGTAVLTANAANRGRLYFVESAPGAADLLYCIMKETDNSYSAVQVAIGATS